MSYEVQSCQVSELCREYGDYQVCDEWLEAMGLKNDKPLEG